MRAYRMYDPDARLSWALSCVTKYLGWYFPDRSEYARRAGIEAIEIARTSGDQVQLGTALRARGMTLGVRDPRRRELFEESLDVLAGSNDSVGIAIGFMVLGEFAFGAERYDDAITCAQEAIVCAEPIDPEYASVALISISNLAQYAVWSGDFAMARSAAAKTFRGARQSGRRDLVTWAMQTAALICLNADDDARAAAQLLGFCDARAGALHVPRQKGMTEDLTRSRVFEGLQSRIGPLRTKAGMLQGARLTEDEAFTVSRLPLQ